MLWINWLELSPCDLHVIEHRIEPLAHIFAPSESFIGKLQYIHCDERSGVHFI